MKQMDILFSLSHVQQHFKSTLSIQKRQLQVIDLLLIHKKSFKTRNYNEFIDL